MRTLAGSIVAVWLVVVVSPARAAEHQMRINEIVLSKGGDATAQFVEMKDLNVSGEPFPNPQYRLDVYDTNATLVGSVPLGITPVLTTDRFAATATADAAFGVTRDDTLTVALPTDGQVCFVDGLNTKIHCVAWGCITTPIVSGVARSASPPDGMSAQRQTNGTYTIGTPTPKTANVAGTPTAACPTDMDGLALDDIGPRVDAGTDPGMGPGGGCCRVDDDRGTPAAIVLALGTLIVLVRRRGVVSG
jgi:hypothetical protein